MRIVFRADASREIGTGHVMRCLTLADALRERGATIGFVSREHVGNLFDVIEQRGFPVSRLPAAGSIAVAEPAPPHVTWLGASWEVDAQQTLIVIRASGARPDWTVVDHYALDHRWEHMLRDSVGGLTVIDDLADRAHDCDLLLDQNGFPDMAERYCTLVPKDCELLLGPRFTLLRREFLDARARQRGRDGVIRRLLVMLGTVDSANHTSAAIEAIGELEWPDVGVDVVTGTANPMREEVRRLCERSGFDYHCQVSNVATLMAEADLAVSAGGFTSYELAFMGLPSVLLPLSAVQEVAAAGMAARGAAITLGRTARFPREVFVRTLGNLKSSPDRCREMGRIGASLFDGLGAARVADRLTRNA